MPLLAACITFFIMFSILMYMFFACIGGKEFFQEKQMLTVIDEWVGANIIAAGLQGISGVGFVAIWQVVAVIVIAVNTLWSFAPWYWPAFLYLIVSILIPCAFIQHRIKKRRQAIEKSLPNILDLLCISVQAGATLDAAMKKVADKMADPLALEFKKVLDDLAFGLGRQKALKRLADRCGVQEVTLFTVAVTQAELLGVGISNIMEAQANIVRHRFRQKIRQELSKVPIKMVFPLIFCIFPTLLVVLLVPAIMRIIRTLSSCI